MWSSPLPSGITAAPKGFYSLPKGRIIKALPVALLAFLPGKPLTYHPAVLSEDHLVPAASLLARIDHHDFTPFIRSV